MALTPVEFRFKWSRALDERSREAFQEDFDKMVASYLGERKVYACSICGKTTHTKGRHIESQAKEGDT